MIDLVLSHTSTHHQWFLHSNSVKKIITVTGMFGLINQMIQSPTTGYQYLEALHGNGLKRDKPTIYTTF